MGFEVHGAGPSSSVHHLDGAQGAGQVAQAGQLAGHQIAVAPAGNPRNPVVSFLRKVGQAIAWPFKKLASALAGQPRAHSGAIKGDALVALKTLAQSPVSESERALHRGTDFGEQFFLDADRNAVVLLPDGHSIYEGLDGLGHDRVAAGFERLVQHYGHDLAQTLTFRLSQASIAGLVGAYEIGGLLTMDGVNGHPIIPPGNKAINFTLGEPTPTGNIPVKVSFREPLDGFLPGGDESKRVNLDPATSFREGSFSCEITPAGDLVVKDSPAPSFRYKMNASQ